MVQFTLRIDESTAAAVRQIAQRNNKSDEEVLLDAVENFVASQRPPFVGAGKYHGGGESVGRHARDILRKAVEDGEWP